MEQIYTIPVNEAFSECAAAKKKAEERGFFCGEKAEETELPFEGSRMAYGGDIEGYECPFCRIYRKLEENELDLILGASMMEPDIRIRTNREGFCRAHYDKMFGRKNRLGMALTMESHLGEIYDEIFGGKVIGKLFPGEKAVNRLGKLKGSCYICGRIEFNFGHMVETAVYLWENDESFREKFASAPYFCLEHYRRMLEAGKKSMERKAHGGFTEAAEGVEKEYFESIRADISWFCKKFDYRYEKEPWGNAKDAIERGIDFLRGKK